MQQFTGFEYILIDIANQTEHDKLSFGERIQWVKTHMDELETLADSADKKPLFIKAVMALRKAQNHQPTGHLVGFDATCSGMQIMSTLTGCVAGATATGLVENKRADAYTACTDLMNNILKEDGLSVNVTRKQAKQALMTMLYGSVKKPIELFGEGTPELKAFYQAAYTLSPGSYKLLEDLKKSWQPYKTFHSWQLPDGFNARVKVMEKIEGQAKNRIQVEELDGASFTYIWYENNGQQRGISNIANEVHSVDAYVLRCIHRRCNYNANAVETAREILQEALDNPQLAKQDKAIEYYKDLYQRSHMADVVILPHLTEENVHSLSHQHIEELLDVIDSMLVHKPFEVVTVHDEFKCHPNHMNHLRQHYINVFAEMADADILSMVFSGIFGRKIKYNKFSNELSGLIRNSNYALT